MLAKKSLGQNFLTSEAAIHKILTAAKISPGEMVLEVGPGKGVLTKALLGAGAKVVAIEKDNRLIGELSEKFSTEISGGKLKIIEQDILEIEPGSIGLNKSEYKIVANLPYYITGEFLRKFLSEENQPNQMVLLLQKEVVERIIARDNKESILSISVKAYGEPKKIGLVLRGSFSPAPNVDSAIISIENISKNFFMEAEISEEKFFEIVRTGFAHKRKLLASNLSEIFPRKKVLQALVSANLPEKIRAEDLKLTDWKNLLKTLTSLTRKSEKFQQLK